MRQINIDVQNVAGPMNRFYQFCVGGGRAYETLVAENQRHLKMVHDDCGFQYVRFHGLLHDDMAVYSEDAAGNPHYNFQYIDLLYDYILSIGMRPLVELSFMPQALASGGQTIFFWRGNVTMPKSLEKWGGLIEALLRHWTERYGEDEVKTWPIEVWNEPNLDGFFASKQPFKDYMLLYEAAAKAIKKVSPSYLVGGPATAGCAWITEMVDACAEKGLPLDFISTHTYGVDGFVDEFGTQALKMCPDEKSITKDVKRVAEAVRNSKMPDLPVYFTEWSSSYSPRDPVHDSYHQASFLLTRLKDSWGSVAAMSYWVFSDIFEEAGPGPQPFHGGFGLINISGIKKPSFFAYKMLNELGNIQIVCDDQRTIAAKDDGGVQVLFWDYTVPAQGKRSDQQYFIRDLPPRSTDPAEIEFTGLKAGRYELTLYGVGYRMNDAYTFYHDLKGGRSDANLSRTEYDYLQNRCSGAPVQEQIVSVGQDGKFIFQRDMRENDVYLLALKRLI